MTFWLEERDLREESGFAIWGPAHISMMIIIVIFLLIAILLFSKLNERKRKVCLCIVAFLLPILEIWKITVLTISERMDAGHLPLHLCSMAIYFYPVISLTQNRRVRETLTEIGQITLLPAAISAVVFPDWTMYPIWNFYSLHAFLWHSLQILFPLLCLFHGWCVPQIRNIWKNTVFLLIGAALIGWFDRQMSCNYWFLRWPIPGTPLQWLYDSFEEGGYLTSLLVLATAIHLAMYGVYGAVCKRIAVRRIGE